MKETQEKTSKPADPLEPFRAMRDAYLDAMAKTMVEAVNTEGYAQATGAMLDGYLTASAPWREAVEKSMLQALQQFSLPSRQEVAALAERFTNVEMRLDDMDAKLDAIQRLLHPDGPVPKSGADERTEPHTAPTRAAGARATTSGDRRTAGRRFVRRGAGPAQR
ncbi:MAG TPA: hypothetical protein VHZ09_03535 [Acidobacteriaceae bacterium]|nr:hypothetical protein [Acidobacteriaceae bacterium]